MHWQASPQETVQTDSRMSTSTAHSKNKYVTQVEHYTLYTG